MQSGEILHDARLAYGTLGSLNRAADNAVVMPTYFTGTHDSYLPMFGSRRPLDPTRYFIIIPDMFGNGLSSSPSNYPQTFSQTCAFPLVTVLDNVTQQARLIFEKLGVSEVALVCGWSLGGMQAYQWATLFPKRVRRLLVFGSAARISTYNLVFLKGLKAVLQVASSLGSKDTNPFDKGVRAFGRVYAGWAYSCVFYRDGLYRKLGYSTLEDFLTGWETDHLRFYGGDLLCMLEAWERADVGANAQFSGEWKRALHAIEARTTLVTCSTDLYFSPSENYQEAELIRNCHIREFNSPFGHCAFSPGKIPSAMRFLDDCLADLLAEA